MNPTTEMIIKETTVWGLFNNSRTLEKRVRLMKKRDILNKYPFVDHYKIYAYKPKTQKGPAKEEQTFIISYAYNYDAFTSDNEFVEELISIGLMFYKEKCIYRGHNAYKIIIYDKECPLLSIINFS